MREGIQDGTAQALLLRGHHEQVEKEVVWIRVILISFENHVLEAEPLCLLLEVWPQRPVTHQDKRHVVPKALDDGCGPEQGMVILAPLQGCHTADNPLGTKPGLKL